MQRSNCLDVDPDLFYPEAGQVQTAVSARKVCVRCPVRADCLEHALKRGEHFGIWGGRTAPERRNPDIWTELAEMRSAS